MNTDNTNPNTNNPTDNNANSANSANASASVSINSGANANLTVGDLEAKTKEELVEMAKEKGIPSPAVMKKHDIIMRLLESYTGEQGNIFCSGILEIMTDGYGFLRQDTLLPSQTDVYISPSQIRRFGLRNGDLVTGQGRPPKSNEKYFSLLQVVAINGLDPEVIKSRQPFGSLTPTFPDRIINLEHSPSDLSTRLINLIAPIGRGQRAASSASARKK
jgi:transcription termination factor Rho